jgi:hypothetical protein
VGPEGDEGELSETENSDVEKLGEEVGHMDGE